MIVFVTDNCVQIALTVVASFFHRGSFAWEKEDITDGRINFARSKSDSL